MLVYGHSIHKHIEITMIEVILRNMYDKGIYMIHVIFPHYLSYTSEIIRTSDPRDVI